MNKFEKHHKLFSEIVNVIKDNSIGELPSIILYGSFSKYEGNWDLNGNIINDIDLILIKENGCDIKKHRIESALLKAFGPDFVDINVIQKAKIGKLPKSIFSYDLYENGKVLNGNIDLEEFQFPKERIPLKDIEILFRTRLWTFIGSYPITGIKKLDAAEKKKFNYQMSKAIFACIDCIAVLRKEYQSKNTDKIEWASKQQEFKIYHHLLDFAQDVKINGNLINGFDSEKLLSQVAAIFEKSFTLGLNKFFNTKKRLIDLVLTKYHNSLRATVIKNLYYLKKKNGYKIMNLILIQYLLFHYLYINRNLGHGRIQEVAKKLRIKSNDIQTIRIRAAELRLEE